MTEQHRSILGTLALAVLVPALVAALALGRADAKIQQAETKADHSADIREVTSMITGAVERLQAQDREQAILLLDVLCAIKPADRRCK